MKLFSKIEEKESSCCLILIFFQHIFFISSDSTQIDNKGKILIKEITKIYGEYKTVRAIECRKYSLEDNQFVWQNIHCQLLNQIHRVCKNFSNVVWFNFTRIFSGEHLSQFFSKVFHHRHLILTRKIAISFYLRSSEVLHKLHLIRLTCEVR